MNLSNSPHSLTHPAAQVAASVFADKAPAAWSQVAAYVDALFMALEQGHSCIDVGANAAKKLALAQPLVGQAGDFVPLVLQGQQLFLGRLWQLEQAIATHLRRLAHAKVEAIDTAMAAAHLTAWFTEPHSQDQQAAAALALLQPLMLINGGPGTGKTTTVAKLLALICQNTLHTNGVHLPRIGLAAPTGKAAAHMAQALHRALNGFAVDNAVAEHLKALEGQTVHRLLSLRAPMSRSTYDAQNPLPLDMVVVDEASMLDLSLLHGLLAALKSGTRLILLGDHHQLPAVGAGDVLAVLAQKTTVSSDLAAQLACLLPSQPFAVDNRAPVLAAHVATLTHSHRFDNTHGIGMLAHAVVAGQPLEALAAFEVSATALQWASSSWLQQPWPILYQKQAAYWQAVANCDVAAAFAGLKAVMVLAAWRQDAALFNQQYSHWLARHGHACAERWFAGQVLMVSQNDYSIGLFNGDFGVVLPDADTGRLMAYFADGHGFRALNLSRLPEHDTAFAITVHKSQGSEYDEVWLLPPSGKDTEHALFDRALLYTAVTRARARFVFLGTTAQLSQAVSQYSPRRSGLKAALAR